MPPKIPKLGLHKWTDSTEIKEGAKMFMHGLELAHVVIALVAFICLAVALKGSPTEVTEIGDFVDDESSFPLSATRFSYTKGNAKVHFDWPLTSITQCDSTKADAKFRIKNCQEDSSTVTSLIWGGAHQKMPYSLALQYAAFSLNNTYADSADWFTRCLQHGDHCLAPPPSGNIGDTAGEYWYHKGVAGCLGQQEVTETFSVNNKITDVSSKSLMHTEEFRAWVSAKLIQDAGSAIDKGECEKAYKAQPFLNKYSFEKGWGDAFGLSLSYTLTISGLLTTAFVMLLQKKNAATDGGGKVIKVEPSPM